MDGIYSLWSKNSDLVRTCSDEFRTTLAATLRLKAHLSAQSRRIDGGDVLGTSNCLIAEFEKHDIIS